MMFKNGDRIWVTADGERMPAQILVASTNQRSLALKLDGGLMIADGAAAILGGLALTLGDDGEYHVLHDLATTVKIKHRD